MPRSGNAVRVAVGLLGILLVVSYLRPDRPDQAVQDGPPSTLSTEPAGARALSDALELVGVEVARFREVMPRLPLALDTTRRQLLAVIGSGNLSPAELQLLWDWTDESDLLLAGRGVEGLSPCYGYKVSLVTQRDNPAEWEKQAGLPTALLPRTRTRVPATATDPKAVRVGAYFEPLSRTMHVDSSRAADALQFECTVAAEQEVDTLLVTRAGEPVVLRIRHPDTGRVTLLAADAELFRNRSFRYTSSGPQVLALMAGHYDAVLFDEYHHGHGPQGALLPLLFRWGRETPWGWSAWHLGIVGLLVLLVGAVRFGPVLPAMVRQRRSPLEHVRALATALAAARGHDEAVTAIVRGLRRRLAPTERHDDDWAAWLRRIRAHAGSARAQGLIDDLLTLATPGQPLESVQRAAHTVEDLWLELRP